MNLLLDTHALLWFVNGNERLGATARGQIEDPANRILVSTASFWEMAIKIGLGRLSVESPFEEFVIRQIDMNGFKSLPIRIAHLSKLIQLPKHHRDPFDRLLAAQCLADSLAIVSADEIFDQYAIQRIWR